MHICGVDPGLQTTGYGVVDMDAGRLQIVDAGIIKPDRGAALCDRLQQIHADLRDVFDDTRPACLAVENVYSHYRHPQTAVLMGHVRGIILLAAAVRGLSVMEIPATRVKRLLTGNGHASKSQVQQAIKLRLGLAEVPEPNDVADALALAVGAAESQRTAALSSSGGTRP